MMLRAALRFLPVLTVLLLASLSMAATGSSRTRTPTPTATPAATPTSTPNPSLPPAPPSGMWVNLKTGGIFWADNSDNEDGFVGDFGACGASYEFTVGPNTTTAQLPPEVLTALSANDCCPLILYSVAAFNSAGRSRPDSTGIIVECWSPMPTPSVRSAPEAGDPRSVHGWVTSGLLALFDVGSIILIAGAAVRAFALGRSRAGRNES
jgi:hypothetical protein